MDTEDEEETCHHNWRYIKDYEGDPSIPNGIHDISHWECLRCGLCCDDPPPEIDFDEYE